MISQKRKLIKNIILVSLIVIFVFGLLYFVYLGDAFNYLIKGKQEKDIVTAIKINGINLPFDKNTKTFFYSVSEEEAGKEKELSIEIEANKKAEYVIDNQRFSDDIVLNTCVDFKKTIDIYSSTSFLYSNYHIQFTNLPVINISNNVENVKDEYEYGSINIFDPNYEENETEYSLESDIKIRIRGQSARYQKKKAYKVRLVDSTNNKKNLSLCGMRTDSDWILDSLYAEDSYIRNGMSYDIWNLVNKDISDEYKVEFKWQLVELIMEDEYIGLYVLKEPVDDDTLDLAKTTNGNSGILLKGITHTTIDFNEHNIKSIKDTTYCGLEIKYPKNLKDNSEYWYKILSKMKNYYSLSINDEIIENTFYMDNFLNYRLLLIALQAVDNYEPRNMYISLKDFNDDTKLILTPWDMDLSFGVIWNDDVELPLKSYDQINTIENKHNYYDDIAFANSPNYVKALKTRWKYLRKEVFNETVINNLVDGYERELTLAGAANRNYIKWEKDTDTITELNEIREWCKKRFEAVDKYINGL